MKKLTCKQTLTAICVVIFTLVLSPMLGQQPISLTFDFNQATGINRDVYGFNEEHIYKEFKDNDPAYIDFIDQLGNPLLRYPAGTGSNYLNLVSGRAEITWDNPNSKDVERIERINNKIDKSKEGALFNYKEWTDYIVQTGNRTTYVVNMTSMTVAENVAVIRYFKSQGADLPYFELGNEIFFGQYRAAMPDVHVYIEKSKQITDSIRVIYPTSKVGVAVHPEYFTDEVFLDGPVVESNRVEYWYHELMHENFFDAIVSHFYTSTGMNGQTAAADFLPYENSYTHSISHLDKKLASTIEQMEHDFPGKEAWITEYHVGGFSGDLRSYRLRYSYLGAFLCSNLMMKLFSYPKVTMSNWHSFTQIMQAKKVGEEWEINRSLNGEFAKLFDEPTKASTHFVPTKIENALKYEGRGEFTGMFSKVDAGTFYNEETKVGYTFFFNKKGNRHSFTVNEFEAAVEGEILSCKEFAPQKTIPTQEAILSESEYSLNENVMPVEGKYTLNPYTIVIVKFQVNTTENQAPIVSFDKPTHLQEYNEGATISVRALASDVDGEIAAVSLYVNETLVRRDDAAPYKWGGSSLLQNTTPGNYVLKVIAEDNEGATTEKTITVIVKALPPIDCAGVSGGTASIDACGVCSGGTTGITPTESQTWYKDTDHDGIGEEQTIESCTQPEGYVSIAGDECPNDSTNTCTIASVEDIIGQDCMIESTTPIQYELSMTNRVGATSYHWWYTGSVPDVIFETEEPYQVKLNVSGFVSEGELCVGVNYNQAPWHETYCKSIGACVNLKEGLLTSSLESQIYPNPFHEELMIHLRENAQQVQVFSIEGQEVYTAEVTTFDQLVINTSTLKAGLYIVQITTNDAIEKITVSKL